MDGPIKRPCLAYPSSMCLVVSYPLAIGNKEEVIRSEGDEPSLEQDESEEAALELLR